MKAYRDPKALAKLVLVAHRLLFGTAAVTVHPSERSAFVSAFARAAQEIPDAWDTNDQNALRDAIARLTIALGHAYQGSRETAFWVADHLLSEAGYQHQMEYGPCCVRDERRQVGERRGVSPPVKAPYRRAYTRPATGPLAKDRCLSFFTQSSRKTICCQLPPDDLQLAHDLLDVAIQSKRPGDVADVLKRHWY